MSDGSRYKLAPGWRKKWLKSVTFSMSNFHNTPSVQAAIRLVTPLVLLGHGEDKTLSGAVLRQNIFDCLPNWARLELAKHQGVDPEHQISKSLSNFVGLEKWLVGWQADGVKLKGHVPKDKARDPIDGVRDMLEELRAEVREIRTRIG